MEAIAVAVAFVALLAWDFGRRSLSKGLGDQSTALETALRGEIAANGARLTVLEAETKAARSRSAHALTEVQAMTGSRRRKQGS